MAGRARTNCKNHGISRHFERGLDNGGERGVYIHKNSILLAAYDFSLELRLPDSPDSAGESESRLLMGGRDDVELIQIGRFDPDPLSC
jgi:hypothetical protein